MTGRQSGRGHYFISRKQKYFQKLRRIQRTEKCKSIKKLLDSPEGRKKLAESMIEPIRRSLEYQAIGKKLLGITEWLDQSKSKKPGRCARWRMKHVQIRLKTHQGSLVKRSVPQWTTDTLEAP